MNLNYLEYFVDVVKYGSISKAARAHYLKQGNLSKYIKAIENEFKATLFTRSSKGVELTEEGQKVFLWAENTLKQRQALMEAFAQQAEGALSGSLTLYLSPSINNDIYAQMLVPFLQQFSSVRIHSHEKNLSAIIERAAAAPNAIGVSILDKRHRQEAAAQESLIVLPVYEKIKFIVYVAKNAQILQSHQSISVKALADLPVLVYAPSQECPSPVVEILSYYGKLNIIQETSNLSLFHSLLHTGQYVAIGINSSYGMEDYDTIAIRDKIELSSCLLVSRENIQVPVVSAFIQFYYAQKQLVCPLESLGGQ